MGKKVLYVVRHGKTNKAMIEGFAGDRDRSLTDQGVAQASQRRQLLKSPEFDRVAASPAPRAVHTACLVAGVEERRVRMIPELYIDDPATGDDARLLDEAFARLGYADLATYLDDKEAGAALARKAEEMNAALYRWLFEAKRDELLLVAGHAVYSPAALLPSLRGKQKFEDALRAVSMVEAGCFQVTFDNGLATNLKVFSD